VKVHEKIDIYSISEIASAISDIENKLNDKGRVLVRYSGTQPLCRVMVEGPDEEETNHYCQHLVDLIREKIGAK